MITQFQTEQIHSHLHSVTQTYRQRLCGCTEGGCWQLSTGSLAGTLASLPSHSVPFQPWGGKTGGKGAKYLF